MRGLLRLMGMVLGEEGEGGRRGGVVGAARRRGIRVLGGGFRQWGIGGGGLRKVAHRQTDCSYYSNRQLLLPDPIVQRCFSSFVTFELVALWRGNDGFGESGGGESIVGGGGELAVSL